MPEYTVGQLIKKMGLPEPITIDHRSYIYTALSRLEKHNIGILPVMRGKRLVGVVTPADYAFKCREFGASPLWNPVSQFMTKRVDVEVINLGAPLSTAVLRMLDAHIRHIIVIGSEGFVVAVLSINDFMRAYFQHHVGIFDGAVAAGAQIQ